MREIEEAGSKTKPASNRFARVLEGKTVSGVVAASGPLRRRRWTDMTFIRCDLSENDLRGSEFRCCSFVDCRFSGSRLAGSAIIRTTFQRCDLRETDWREGVFREVVLEDCAMDRATLALGVFERVLLRGTAVTVSQTGRTFGSGAWTFEGAPGESRWKCRLRSAIALLAIATSFTIAGVVVRPGQNPSQWTREAFSQNIDQARGEGDLDRALRYAELGAGKWEADPNFVQLSRNLKAEILLARLAEDDDSEDVLMAVEKVLQERDLEPRLYVDLLLREAEMLISRRDEELALEVLLEARGKTPVAAETYGGIKRLAGLLEQLGSPGAAEPLLRSLVDAQGLMEVERRDAQLYLANILHTQGRVPEAEAVYREVLAHGSDPGQIAHSLESLAILASRRGDFVQAEGFYREIAKRLPGTPWAQEMSWWGLADLYEQTGRPREALRALEQILEASVDPSRLSWSLMKVFQIAGRLHDAAAARSAYRRLQKEFPDSEPARLARQEEASSAAILSAE